MPPGGDAREVSPARGGAFAGRGVRPRACIFPLARWAAPRPIRLFINNDAPGGEKKINAFKNQTGWEGWVSVFLCTGAEGRARARERVGALVKAIKLRSLPWRDSGGYNALGGSGVYLKILDKR